MSTVRTTLPSLKLTCLEGDQCSVYLEPWGTEYILLKGDVFHVQTEALASGDVEISYVNGGISIAFHVDVPIYITDGTGRSLPI
ncbi:hypothetical protein [Actinophytocola algeriensis]|uniref:Uncharacterized protein n=1 Tax=Actinophytocola algeriensis TaxID=1768010 RepID=A0A7W7VFY6_9PSEU|nr:hypothetical protein [Actinophytocola algeriensis]MBB4908877.1 hypothetical protein [Actinophytocola algeriensis]MBE1474735.1 hypothetical protein [Actinophytocola algeriensis]